jgi:predicted metal-binding membrane protein
MATGEVAGARTASRDTPRAAYRVLELRATLLTAGLLLLLAAGAWWSVVLRVRDMGGGGGMGGGMGDGMDMGGDTGPMGLAAVGTAMTPFDMDAGLFLAMWVTMMVAMMFPTIAPIVLLHRMVLRRGGHGPGRTVAFVGGYLLVWGLVGLVPLAALVAFRSLSDDTSWVAPAAGAVLLLAGAYQFSAWKEACQRACRTPLTFLSTHDFGTGWVGALRTGATHGLYCLGCCWALMAVLFVVGLMNLAWMAAISVVFLTEKHWRHGLTLARVVGAATAALGIAVLVQPSVLTWAT